MHDHQAITLILGADHGGYADKEALKPWLANEGFEVIDVGADHLDPEDDYPVIAFAVGEAVAARSASYGILFCRSGGGMVIAANKVPGVRAVQVRSVEETIHARSHNDANVLALAADWTNHQEMKEIVQVFFATKPRDASRHERRIAQITAYERDHQARGTA